MFYIYYNFNYILIRVGVLLSHILPHTDSKDFNDVGFADYAYHDALQGRVLYPTVTRMAHRVAACGVAIFQIFLIRVKNQPNSFRAHLAAS